MMQPIDGFSDEDVSDASDGEADALLESLRALNAEMSSAVGQIGGRECNADAAAEAMHRQLRKTAAGIIADVVAGREAEASTNASSSASQPPSISTDATAIADADAELLEEDRPWIPDAAAVPPRCQHGARGTAIGSRSGNHSAGGHDSSNVATVVGDISRLAAKPLLADSHSFAAAPPRRGIGTFSSGSQLGGLTRSGRGRGGGRLPP